MWINENYYQACCQTAIKQNACRCPICNTNLPYRTTARNLIEGDHVQHMDGGAYRTATVKRIDGGPDPSTVRAVTLIRPYIHTSDFITTDGIQTTIGWEQYDLWPDNKVIVLQESRVRDALKTASDGRRYRAGFAPYDR